VYVEREQLQLPQRLKKPLLDMMDRYYLEVDAVVEKDFSHRFFSEAEEEANKGFPLVSQRMWADLERLLAGESAAVHQAVYGFLENQNNFRQPKIKSKQEKKQVTDEVVLHGTIAIAKFNMRQRIGPMFFEGRTRDEVRLASDIVHRRRYIPIDLIDQALQTPEARRELLGDDFAYCRVTVAS
jgi:hypothetical protein